MARAGGERGATRPPSGVALRRRTWVTPAVQRAACRSGAEPLPRTASHPIRAACAEVGTSRCSRSPTRCRCSRRAPAGGDAPDQGWHTITNTPSPLVPTQSRPRPRGRPGPTRGQNHSSSTGRGTYFVSARSDISGCSFKPLICREPSSQIDVRAVRPADRDREPQIRTEASYLLSHNCCVLNCFGASAHRLRGLAYRDSRRARPVRASVAARRLSPRSRVECRTGKSVPGEEGASAEAFVHRHRVLEVIEGRVLFAECVGKGPENATHGAPAHDAVRQHDDVAAAAGVTARTTRHSSRGFPQDRRGIRERREHAPRAGRRGESRRGRRRQAVRASPAPRRAHRGR